MANDSNPIALNFNSEGSITMQLPPGPSNDDNRLYLFVQVFDDSDSYTKYELANPVVVKIDQALVEEAMNGILNDPANFKDNLLSLDADAAANTLIIFSHILNEQARSNDSSNSSVTFNYKLIFEEDLIFILNIP